MKLNSQNQKCVSSQQSDDDLNQQKSPIRNQSLQSSDERSNSSSSQQSQQSDLKLDKNKLIFGSDLAEELRGFDDRQHAQEVLEGFSSFSSEDEDQKVVKEPVKVAREPEVKNPEKQKISKVFLEESDVSKDKDSDFELPVMFKEKGGQVRVIKFSEIFIPSSEKQTECHRLFNQLQMETRERENEEDRANKRKLKEDYKMLSKIFQHKAANLPVNPFLEDFLYLQKKSGPKDKSKSTYKKEFQTNTLISKIMILPLSSLNQKRKMNKAIQAEKTNQVAEVDDNQQQILLDSCRVEELLPKFLKQSVQQLANKLKKRFPAPHFSQIQKQIFAHLKNQNEDTNINAQDITDHMMQESMIEQRYSTLRDQGQTIKRQKYWGELQDASSAQQLEKDKFICQKYEPKSPKVFKLKDKTKGDKTQQKTSQVNGMIEDFKEYESVKKSQQQLFADKKSNVTARSIMRYIRYKMGALTDQEFYELETKENQTTITEVIQKQIREPIKNFEENLDVHFNSRRQEIQQEIIKKKKEKESQSQQNAKQMTTTAYEPISALEPIMKEKAALAAAEQPEQNNQMNQHHSDQSVSSSSDSDDDNQDYLDKASRQTGDRVLPTLANELNHAKCIKDLSFYKLNWEDKDLSHFHRPDIQQSFNSWQTLQACPITLRKDDEQNRLNPQDYFKDRFKLSLAKGKFSIFEHIDQHPLFVNNFGMASKLKRYYYDSSIPNKKVFYQRQENKRTRHMGPSGEIILKQPPEYVDPQKPELGLIPTQRLELLGQINTKEYLGVSVLENKMYNAPVFFHNSDAAPRTDFFCSIVQSKQSNEQKIIIREFDSLYTVGQIEPKVEVYNPQSRYFQNFIKQRAKAYIIRFLQENEVIKFADIIDFFPQIREQILKNSLKESEIEIDRNGECKFTDKFDEQRFKDRMTPEMICQYESARHGQYRLQVIGISQILSADKISYSMGKFNREETDMTLRRIAKLIESEVLSTPWNLSSSFIKVKQEGSMMLLNGAGDPSYGYGGYSFIKMPLKISGDSLQGAKENRMNLNPAIKNPKAVTRTDADLRKLQKKDIFEKLLTQGYTEEMLRDKTRWQMVGMLRHNAPNLPEYKKFARGVRYTSNKQREKYNTNANEKFEQQMKNLSSLQPSYIHHFSEDEPDFTYSDEKKIARPGQGQNAADFTDDIRSLTQDAIRKLSVETTLDKVRDIQKIEDIPNYLNLLLLKLDKMPPQPGAQQQGIPIGGSSTTQINSDFLESLGQEQIDDLKIILLDKLNSGEINKKQNVICKMIRSLVYSSFFNNNSDFPMSQGELNEASQFTRVIFCASEKMIKKFDRARKKNETTQRVPRNKKPLLQAGRNLPGLTAEELVTGTNKSGGSVASKSRSGNQEVIGAGSSIYSGLIGKQKAKQFSAKKKKPIVEQSQPIIKINFNAAAENQSSTIALPLIYPQSQVQQTNAKTMISLRMQPDFLNEDDQEMVVSMSQEEEIDEGFDEDYGEEDGAGMMNEDRNQLVRLTTQNFQKSSKQRKQKKQPQTTTRVKSHGCGKDDYEYAQTITNNRSHRKRQQQCGEALNQIFGEILQRLMDHDEKQIFHNQVTNKEAPSYRDLIRKPICLKDMKNRTKRNEYKSRDELLQDIELMRNNAEIFNGKMNPISELACELEDLASQQVESKIGEILNLEALVREGNYTM